LKEVLKMLKACDAYIKGSSEKSRGQSAVEISLVFIVFFVLFFALGDMVKISYSWLSLQYATNRGIRAAKMLPTEMPMLSKAYKVQEEVVRTSRAVGVSLENSNVAVSKSGSDLVVEITKEIHLFPLAGVLQSIGGDRSGVYTIKTKEMIRDVEL
jgi:hypothetical protein